MEEREERHEKLLCKEGRTGGTDNLCDAPMYPVLDRFALAIREGRASPGMILTYNPPPARAPRFKHEKCFFACLGENKKTETCEITLELHTCSKCRHSGF